MMPTWHQSDPMSGYARESETEKKIATIRDFYLQCQLFCLSTRLFYVTIADADIESLKSLHTLFDKYLDHMLVKFEQNLMVCTITKFVFFWQKLGTIFWQSGDTILEDVPVTETIAWC